jgi:hypothetical protein
MNSAAVRANLPGVELVQLSLPRLRLFLAVLVAALGAAGSAAAYPWPVKPFTKQHPVRANFGDPRTIFLLPLFDDGIDGPGDFQFHNGIDISAPDGTEVYPVMSGTAKLINGLAVGVDTGTGRSFQYWHIVPVVLDGEHVVAGQTVLGYVAHSYGHVHLSEFRGGRIWNPLSKGGIAPYRDTVKPTVSSILFRAWNTLPELDPLGLCGKISIVAEAYDMPQLKVTGTFAGFPVAPALVTWTLRRVAGELIVPPTVAVDFRGTLPSAADFWDVYARGTYQNAPRFERRQFNLMPGRFLFQLTKQGLDTRTLPNGVYQVTVQASDIRGHARSLSRRFTIVNQPSTESGCAQPPPPAPPR